MGIVPGTFNSKKFWKVKNFAGLPQFDNLEFNATISALDELQVMFCNLDDILVCSLLLSASNLLQGLLKSNRCLCNSLIIF